MVDHILLALTVLCKQMSAEDDSYMQWRRYTRSNDLAGRSTALAPPCLLLSIDRIKDLIEPFSINREEVQSVCVLTQSTNPTKPRHRQ